MILEKFIVFDYLKANKVIKYPDMIRIKEQENISIPDQMKALKILESENKLKDESYSATEPIFKLITKESSFEELFQGEFSLKNQNIREKFFKYLYEKNGYFNELEFFIEYGVSIDIQTKVISRLIEEGSIIKTTIGYEIKRKNS